MRLSTLILGGILSFAAMGCMPSSQAQAIGHADAPAQTQARTPPSNSKKSDGAWHHFGERSSASPSRISDLEKQTYELINRDRLNAARAGGRSRPLRWNEKLAEVARAHSRDMLRRGYFGHVDSEGKSIGDRLKGAGIAWRAAGENIGTAQTAAEAETEFMNEPQSEQNHRWNILNPNYTDVGVGVVEGPDGQYYFTEDFLRSAPGN